MELSVGILNQAGRIDEKLKQFLSENASSIKDVIYAKDLTDSENKAFQRNKILERVDSDYILWVSDVSVPDEDFLEEMLETLEEYPDADVIYPNEVLIDLNNQENVRNFKDFYGEEKELLQGLAFEKYLPEFGVITKKEIFSKFGTFDEEFEDYEFYRFLAFNIKNLRLKHSELSFITNKIAKTFIDTSFHSKTVRDILKTYDWKKDIFPLLNWENEKVAKSTANTIAGDMVSQYYDFYNASNFYREAVLAFHNQHSLKKLIDTFIQMGFFDKARYLLEKQGMSEEDVKEYEEKISNFEKIVKNLEEAVKEGKYEDVLRAIVDVSSVYEGAPIYNILGVVHFIGKDYEGAYRFLYKATTMNPMREEYVENLFEVARLLNKEENVKGLLNRLVEED